MKKKSDTDKSRSVKKNTKRAHKSAQDNENLPGRSILTGELPLILLGASLVTLIVFFVFFSPSVKESGSKSVNNINIRSLEKRIADLEAILRNSEKKGANLASSGSSGKTATANPSIESYKARVERVEAALSVKFNTLSQRLDTVTKKLSVLSKKINQQVHLSKKRKWAVKQYKNKKIQSKTVKNKRPIHKKYKTVKKTKFNKKKSIFHVVKKGETLYAISRKYKISVNRLRALNKLTKKSAIYPGEMLLVK